MENEMKKLATFNGRLVKDDNSIIVNVTVGVNKTNAKALHYSITAESHDCDSLSGVLNIAPASIGDNVKFFDNLAIGEICSRIQNENAFIQGTKWSIHFEAQMDAHAIAAGYEANGEKTEERPERPPEAVNPYGMAGA